MARLGNTTARRYLHLAEDARTFYWAAERGFGRVDPCVVVSEVFDGWENLEPTDSERVALASVF